MSAALELRTSTAAGTRAVGIALAQQLHGGEVVALNGPLGAGKTQFAKGLAVGLQAAEADAVVSPTFVLVREYAGRRKLLHVDAYRLGSAAELLELGLADLWGAADTVVAIEWAERFAPFLPADTITVELAYDADGDCRRIRIRADDACLDRLRRVLTGSAQAEEIAECGPAPGD